MSKKYIGLGMIYWLSLALLVSLLVNPKSPEVGKAFWNAGIWVAMLPIALLLVSLHYYYQEQITRLQKDERFGWFANIMFWINTVGIGARNYAHASPDTRWFPILVMLLSLFTIFSIGVHIVRTLRSRRTSK